jgi:hypothetical protein
LRNPSLRVAHSTKSTQYGMLDSLKASFKLARASKLRGLSPTRHKSRSEFLPASPRAREPNAQASKLGTWLCRMVCTICRWSGRMDRVIKGTIFSIETANIQSFISWRAALWHSASLKLQRSIRRLIPTLKSTAHPCTCDMRLI